MIWYRRRRMFLRFGTKEAQHADDIASHFNCQLARLVRELMGDIMHAEGFMGLSTWDEVVIPVVA